MPYVLHSTFSTAGIDFSHYRNKSECKEINTIDFLPRCYIYIYIACKSGCKTIPCEIIEAFSVSQPLIILWSK